MTAAPPHVATLRLKYGVDLRRARAESDASSRPYVGLEHIESTTGRLLGTQEPSKSAASDDSPSPQAGVFESGDVLFGKLRPYLAKTWVAEFAGRCTTELLVMTPREFDARFLRYVCLSPSFINEVDASTFGSKMPRAEWDFIGGCRVPAPSLDRQRAIADYLDRETSKLDAMVAAKERLLDLLAEKRRALITHAVTRGLNPTAPTKHSGIEWLSEIPKHWEIWKLGHLATVGNGSTPKRDNADYWFEGSIPWLNSSVVNQDEVTAADQFVTPLAMRECHLPLVPAGSVLVAITGQGKTRGQAVVLTIPATINQHMAYITPHRKLDPTFLRWTLYAMYDYLRTISDDAGGTKGALTCEDIASLRLPIPDLDEQREIVHRIISIAATIDSLKAAAEKTIGLLRERRAALIAAAVTGAIDVEAAA